MRHLDRYLQRVGEHFRSELGSILKEAYKLGSLAHGGFSQAYSDIDVGLIFSCQEPPMQVENVIASAKELDPVYGKKLSVFWGNPEWNWGRLPALDRLDLLDHGVPLLNGVRAAFSRPSKVEIRDALRESIEKSWKPRIRMFRELRALEPRDRKPYIRCILYPARLIFSWDRLAVDSNDRAVEYLQEVKPAGLDLQPIELALGCRHDKVSAEEVFALRPDLDHQFVRTLSYLETIG